MLQEQLVLLAAGPSLQLPISYAVNNKKAIVGAFWVKLEASLNLWDFFFLGEIDCNEKTLMGNITTRTKTFKEEWVSWMY